jgi:hypothetical protein
MSKNAEGLEPKECRLVRFGLPVDSWLVDYVIANDFKSVPELVRHIVREFKRTQGHTRSNAARSRAKAVARSNQA